MTQPRDECPLRMDEQRMWITLILKRYTHDADYYCLEEARADMLLLITAYHEAKCAECKRPEAKEPKYDNAAHEAHYFARLQNPLGWGIDPR